MESRMSREILFRGKRVDNGEWVAGCLLIDDMFAEKSKWNYDIVFRNKRMAKDKAMVISSTVGQYTGLTDKNGNKIFEGDILRQKTTKEFSKYNPSEWERYGIVRFDCHDWRPGWLGYESIGWYLEPLKKVAINPPNLKVSDMHAGINQSYIIDKCYPYEVIGNIHDNPELLEE